MSNPFDPTPEQKPVNPFAEVPSSAPSGNLSKNLGHQARGKQLSVARWILIVIGLLTAGVNIFQVMNVDELLNREIRNQGGNPAAVPKEIMDQARNMVVLMGGILSAVGIAFVIMGIAIYSFPVPITITALIIYVASAAIFAVLDPSSIVRGLIIKILIIVALAKSIGAATEYEKERKSYSM